MDYLVILQSKESSHGLGEPEKTKNNEENKEAYNTYNLINPEPENKRNKRSNSICKEINLSPSPPSKSQVTIAFIWKKRKSRLFLSNILSNFVVI